MSKSTQPILNALILVGGKSKRMGKDKSLLNYHGIPQWQFLVSELEGLVTKTYLSVRKGQTFDYPYLIEDKHEGLGPFGAILTALETYPNQSFLVIATDLPLVDKDILNLLISNRDIAKFATTFQAKNKDYPEPLLCIWESKSIAFLNDFYKKGIYKPIQVLRKMEIKRISVTDKILSNINTQDELLAFHHKKSPTNL